MAFCLYPFGMQILLLESVVNCFVFGNRNSSEEIQFNVLCFNLYVFGMRPIFDLEWKTVLRTHPINGCRFS